MYVNNILGSSLPKCQREFLCSRNYDADNNRVVYLCKYCNICADMGVSFITRDEFESMDARCLSAILPYCQECESTGTHEYRAVPYDCLWNISYDKSDDISDEDLPKKNLTKVTTRALRKELSERGGVKYVEVDPYDRTSIDVEGPAAILIITD